MVCQACRDNARDLLRRNDKIAYAVGFSSQRHLTANFRRTMGVTPRKFRGSLVSANVR
jgi:AraC-like DNA-binding protein